MPVLHYDSTSDIQVINKNPYFCQILIKTLDKYEDILFLVKRLH